VARSLDAYNAKRDFGKTPEPAPGDAGEGDGSRPRFVVQEHHARRLHWDFRLERDGVGVSWAVPKGIPPDPSVNHLAVPTEDHPLSYFDFAGQIPRGEYGAGSVSIWDHGWYECEKWSDREVKVVLHGQRVQGRYVLFRTGEKLWMIHRMDPPQDPEREPMPELGTIVPMKAVTAAGLPADGERWAFEIKWDGFRTLAFVAGGTVRLQSRSLNESTAEFPELRGLGEAVASHEVVLDGEVVALDEAGRPSFGLLQQRGKRRAPIVYMIFDLLYLDGRSTVGLRYDERRARLEGLALRGPSWQVPAHHVGDGEALLAASRAQGLEGLVAKRLDSPYEVGKRSRCWLKVKNWGRQELVVGGWMPGEGERSGRIGALLVGYYEGGSLRYAGRVGTGFTGAELERLAGLLAPLARDAPPFAPVESLPAEVRRLGRWVEPQLVAEVAFSEWTHLGTLRQPSYKGLRTDKRAAEVVRETPPTA
jgi:bifunctional non-homologous end joining protein LigD